MFWQFVFALALISILLFGYPAWRLGDWFGLSAFWHTVFVLTLFSSQFVSRLLLRHRRGLGVTMVRRSADALMGVAPTLLLAVLIGEGLVGLNLLAPERVALLVVGAVVLVGLWGTYAAWRPQVKNIAVHSDKLSGPLRFVQLSDVHIGSRSDRFLRSVVRQVKALAPDFVCITGDFVDQKGLARERFQPLSDLGMPIYFTTGNHEHYEDLENILDHLRAQGVEALRGRCVDAHGLQIIGVDDHADAAAFAAKLKSIVTRPAGADRFRLLLYHRPHGVQAVADLGIDLMIAGHTHDGQIKPFNWLVKTQFKYLRGLHRVADTLLYVNQGTGTWGPVMRVGTRCEITHFTLAP